ncbi:PREDICTED: testis-expressed sequence 9 protein [Ceratosolen solmsi marchali]|uniref:Testis-expressed sequence 9 protein n=1 Tax=Ceratosolen solmsi marchali TaxID=326594 RepID=A0AAJ6YYA8_9HYME|nr:PREDICTED: testis-expressed sequence 9 protein [Ceratosolen solmsi marchali]
MFSESLLNKERNFLELNKELEEKVKNLMVEVDSIITRQEDVIRIPKQSSQILQKKNKIKIKETESIMKIDEEISGINIDTPCIKKSIKNENIKKTIQNEYETYNDDEYESIETKKKRSTNETIIRFLKAQLTQLHTDIQSIQYDLKKKNEHCKELEIEIKNHDEKREKLLNQLTIQKENTVKTETINLELQSKIQAQNIEISSLRKEIDNLKKDLKLLNQVSSNSELRLNRSLEENEKFRSSLKISQNEEKDLREQIRKIQEEKRLALKNSEKQRAEIFQAFKKQVQLVDNLKKQKMYLEASKEIQFIEEDFTKLLEWKEKT